MPLLARQRVVLVAGLVAGACVVLQLASDPDVSWSTGGPAALLTCVTWLLLPARAPWAIAPMLPALVLGDQAGGGGESLTASVITLLAVTYRIGETQDRRTALWLLAAITLTGQVFVILSGEWYPGDILFATTVYGLPMLLGSVVAQGRREQGLLEERTAELERRREERAALEAEAERERLAVQVNEVVTDALRSMVDHADQGTADPVALVAHLEAIEETGRDALRDMRRLLGVLREET